MNFASYVRSFTRIKRSFQNIYDCKCQEDIVNRKFRNNYMVKGHLLNTQTFRKVVSKTSYLQFGFFDIPMSAVHFESGPFMLNKV